MVAVLVIGDGRAQVIHAGEGGLPGPGNAFGRFGCRNHPGLERGMIRARKADKLDSREARRLHARVQVLERAEHRRCEALCDGDIVEAAVAELRPQSFPPVHSIVTASSTVVPQFLVSTSSSDAPCDAVPGGQCGPVKYR